MNARVAPNTSTEVQLPQAGISLSLADLNAHIAMELAAGLSDARGIREKYNISEQSWAVLSKNKIFRRMLSEAIQNLSGDMNAGARITKKAEVLLEDMLPVLHRIVHDPDTSVQSKIDAIKETRTITGRDKKDPAGGFTPGNGFTINIHTGGAREQLVIPAQRILEAFKDE